MPVSKSVKQRPNGVWRARYRDLDGKEHAKHFKRKIDAQQWLDEVTTSVLTGQYVSPDAGRQTLSEYFTDWSARQVWEAGTLRGMTTAIRLCTFSGTRLRDIHKTHVEAWVKRMVDEGQAPNTIHSKVQHVRSTLRAAVRDKQIPEDPTVDVKLPRRRRLEMSIVIPTSAQVTALYDAAPDFFKAAIALAAFAGLRIGEIAGVQLPDINFLKRSLHVTRQVQKEPKLEPEVRAPKYGSERVIPLPDNLLELLSQHVKNIGVFGPEKWLFPGDIPTPRKLEHWWRITVAQAGVKGLTPHRLRHFYASGLIAAGCDVVTVQRAMGHKSATVTLNTYSHLWPTAEDRTRQAASALVANSFADSLRTGTG